MTSVIWTRDLIRRRRALHDALDRLAAGEPATAARLRLTLHTLRSDVEAGRIDAARFEAELAGLECAAAEARALRAA